MSRPIRRLGPLEDLALVLASEWLEEPFINRTQEKYQAIAERMPSIEALHAYSKQRLPELKESGYLRGVKICQFKAGDRAFWYADYPDSISRETIRNALVVSGFRELASRSVGQANSLNLL